MGLLKKIEWRDDSRNTIVHKYDLKNDYIAKGSKLTVRESQAAVFSTKGKMADVFLPGMYTLDTDSVPFLTKLMSWKYGFENPFRSEVYFVSTKQFTNLKWGTANPIIIRDKDYGAVRVRGYGSYAFKVSDPYIFMQEISGTVSSYDTDEITDWLKSQLVMHVTDAIGECKIPVLDMAANLIELSEIVRKLMQPSFEAIGLELTKFVFENFSMPKELEAALDKNTSLGIMRGNLDAYMAMAQADALKDAAKNPGMGGAAMGAGMGFGMGNMFGNMFANNNAGKVEEKITCAKCGASVKKGTKFCPECGKPTGAVCPKCGASVKEGAKFCPECGSKLAAVCPECGASVSAGTKFCPECGKKL